MTQELSTFEKLKESEHLMRKQLIMQAATNLLSSKQFHEISIRDIAKEADIYLALIYKYFHNQDDLFLEILVESVEGIISRIQEEHQLKPFTIRKLASRIVDDLLENETYFKLTCNFLNRGWNNTEVHNKFLRFKKYFRFSLWELIKTTGVKDDDQIYTRGFMATVVGIVLTIGNDTELSKEEQKKMMHTIVNHHINNNFKVFSKQNES